MKLYDSKMAPNPRRVRMFLAEKGIKVDLVPVDIMKQEHKTPEYRAKSPQALLPALELDDGTVITESVAICRYFEELQPEPPLFGATALEKALVEMWNRRMEFGVLFATAMVFRHTHPAMAPLEVPQCQDWGQANVDKVRASWEWMDRELATRPFIAGENFSIADITGFVGVQFGKVVKLQPDESYKNLTRWMGEIAARPSAGA